MPAAGLSACLETALLFCTIQQGDPIMHRFMSGTGQQKLR
jgi:hypothetical protein